MRRGFAQEILDRKQDGCPFCTDDSPVRLYLIESDEEEGFCGPIEHAHWACDECASDKGWTDPEDEEEFLKIVEEQEELGW